MQLAMDLGVDQAFDYKTDDLTKENREFDLIFDTPGKMGFSDAKKMLKRSGSYVTTKPSGSQFAAVLTNLFSSRKNKMVITTGKAAYMVAINKLVENENLNVMVGKSSSFANALEAIRFFEEGGRAPGKQVISMQ